MSTSTTKTVPSFDGDARSFGDYVTNVYWFVLANLDNQHSQFSAKTMAPALAMNLVPGSTAHGAVAQLTHSQLTDDSLLKIEGTVDPRGFPTGAEIPKCVYHLVDAIALAGFQISSEDGLFNDLVAFYNIRRLPDERMTEFVHRFEKFKTKASKAGALGDDKVMGRLLLDRANITAEDRHKVVGSIGTSGYSVAIVRDILRSLFAAFDASCGPSASTPSLQLVHQAETTDSPAPSSAPGSHPLSRVAKWQSLVEEIDIEIRIPGEEALVTRSVFIPRDRAKTKVLTGRGKGAMKWTPGCWDCGALDHIRRDCTKAKLDIGGKVKPPHVYVASSISSCESSLSTHQPSKLLPVGILDSACTSPVCGSVWLSRYESLLPRGHSVVRSHQHVEFSFGRDVRTSLVAAVIPIWIDNRPRHHRVSVITEVVNDTSTYLPLLLSRTCHKLLGLIVNHVHGGILVLSDRHSTAASDTVTIVGHRVPSVVVSSHQALSLLPSSDSDNLVANVEAFVANAGLSLDDRLTLRRELTRLHRFYGHSPGLSDLLHRAGQDTPLVTELLRDIVSSCTVCLSTGQPAPRPKTCLPLTYDLNGVVALDVFFVGNHPILHIIDVATRFNTAVVLRKGRSSANIIAAVEAHWISILGYPVSFFADDAGETKSQEFLAFCALHNIGVHLTAAQSQFANGICERHGGVLKFTIDRLYTDFPAAPLEGLVSKAVLIHNSMCSVDGSSPLQRLCGLNPRLPSVLSDSPASLGPAGPSQQSGDAPDRLAQMQSARTSFAAAQSSRSLKLALASKLHASSTAVYALDDAVYFWTAPSANQSYRAWRLGKVAGVSPTSHVISILHGDRIYPRHPRCVRPATDHSLRSQAQRDDPPDNLEPTDLLSENQMPVAVAPFQPVFPNPPRPTTPTPVTSPASGTDLQGAPAPNPSIELPNSPVRVQPLPEFQVPTLVSSPLSTPAIAAPTPVRRSTRIQAHDYHHAVLKPSPRPAVPTPAESQSASLTTSVNPSQTLSPPPRLSRLPPDARSWRSPSIPSVAAELQAVLQSCGPELSVPTPAGLGNSFDPVATPPSAADPLPSSSDLPVPAWRPCNDHLDISEVIDMPVGPESESVLKTTRSREVHARDQGSDFDAAKLQEIADLRHYEVVRECLLQDVPRNHQVVDVRFVCEWKDKGKATLTPCARLVALGFQERTGTEPIDSPTATQSSLKLVSFVAARNQWLLQSIDFKRAFLQARARSPTDNVIVIIPPPEANVPDNTVWVLEKSIYGLRSAPKEWWLTLVQALLEIGFTQSQQDVAVFTYVSKGDVQGVMAVHVDDVLTSGNQFYSDTILAAVESRFQTRDRAVDRFSHLGIQFERLPDHSVSLCQTRFIDALEPVQLPADGVDLSPAVCTATQQLIGSFLWLAANTRMDIAADASILAGSMRTPSRATVLAANKLLRYLKYSRTAPLTIRPIVGLLDVRVYADSALGNREHGRSQGGLVICVCPKSAPIGGEHPVAVTGWKSSALRQVVISSFSAELINLVHAFDEVVWSTNLLSEMLGVAVPIIALSDCQSVIDNSASLRLQVREKGLSRYMYYVRDVLRRGVISALYHIPTTRMLADGLTKLAPGRRRDALRLALSGTTA